MFNLKSLLPFTKEKNNFWTKKYIKNDLLFLWIILLPVLILVIFSFIYYWIGYSEENFVIAFQKYSELFMIAYWLIFVTILIDVYIKMSEEWFKLNKKVRILGAIFILLIITLLSYWIWYSLWVDIKNTETLKLRIK